MPRQRPRNRCWTGLSCSDLRRLPYPTAEEVIRLGQHVNSAMPCQEKIDTLLREELPQMAIDDGGLDPVRARRKVQEATHALSLAPGSHSDLIKCVLEDFCARFTPDAELLFVAGEEVPALKRLRALGVEIDQHGKMPDVVVYCPDDNWLVLIEAVTSHGPMSPKRRGELAALFAQSTADLVYVTAFPSRQVMVSYLPEISWETEVWVADSPGHLIHFDGERFLGPYEG